MLIKLVELVDGHAADCEHAPRRERRIAVFAEHVAIHVRGIDMIMLADDVLEAHRLKRRARAEKMPHRVAKLRRRYERRDVERVCDHDEYCVRRVLHDFRHDLAKHLCILTRECQTLMAHACEDARPSRADDDVRVLEVFPCARVDIHARVEVRRERVHHVERLAVRYLMANIYADDFRRELHCDSLRQNSRADMAETENGEFLITFHGKTPLFFEMD